MFHWDNGLFFNRPRLGLDVRRRQPHGFVSHAHADHIGPHELAYCTPATACLYRLRLGEHRQTKEIPYRQPYLFGDVRMTLYPAGHCLGSAMVLLEGDHGSLLYTGDFKLGESFTAEQAELPRADVLVMESTFGRPRYRMPARSDTIGQLIELCRDALARNCTPVLHAYPLGKSQEATKILTDAGIPVLQHPAIFAVSERYRQCGVDLGDMRAFDPKLLPGRAVITLPQRSRQFRLGGIRNPISIAITGWAIDSSTKYRWGVDYALPLSDHADFDELIEAAERVGADQIYCMHGPAEFVGHLQAAGFNAQPVQGSYQRRMF